MGEEKNEFYENGGVSIGREIGVFEEGDDRQGDEFDGNFGRYGSPEFYELGGTGVGISERSGECERE